MSDVHINMDSDLTDYIYATCKHSLTHSHTHTHTHTVTHILKHTHILMHTHLHTHTHKHTHARTHTHTHCWIVTHNLPCWVSGSFPVPLLQTWRGTWQENDIVAKILNLREVTKRITRDFMEEFPRLRCWKNLVVVEMAHQFWMPSQPWVIFVFGLMIT